MGFLSWLRGSSASSSPDPDGERAGLDWQSLEDAIAQAVSSQTAAFAASHPGEKFYGFALDCNAYYANILFCLNTPEALEAAVHRYSKRASPEAVAQQRNDLLWGLGDWKYHGFNLDSPDWAGQVPMLDGFAELPNPNDTEEFLVVCCKALLRAEKSGAFSNLARTPDFRVACIDHDEDIAAGDARLTRIRSSLNY